MISPWLFTFKYTTNIIKYNQNHKKQLSTPKIKPNPKITQTKTRFKSKKKQKPNKPFIYQLIVKYLLSLFVA